MKDEIKLQDLNWFEYEQSRVLIFFSTSWCAPCKNMAPIIDEVSILYFEQLKVVKIDVDEQTQLAKKLNVKGVPTLVLLDSDGNQSMLAGGVSAMKVRHWLDTSLNGAFESNINALQND